jgi:apolipoprotein N-acyltransferase
MRRKVVRKTPTVIYHLSLTGQEANNLAETQRKSDAQAYKALGWVFGVLIAMGLLLWPWQHLDTYPFVAWPAIIAEFAVGLVAVLAFLGSRIK